MNISVIISTYNREGTLIRALNSVLSQSLPPGEIIIVDDGSTDQTATQMNNYPGIKYIRQSHSGVSSARNTGILNSKNEWNAFLDDDDEWHKDKLKEQVESLNKDPGYHIIHTNEIWIRNGISVNQQLKHSKRGGYIFQDCLPLCVISPSSVMIHKTIFDDVGMFNETLPACEDYDLWLRICYKYPVLYTDKKLVIKYGGHDDQLSKKYWGMDRFRIKALSNIIRQGQLKEDDLKSAIQTMHNKIHIYQNGAKKHANYNAATEFQHLLFEHPLPQ